MKISDSKLMTLGGIAMVVIAVTAWFVAAPAAVQNSSGQTGRARPFMESRAETMGAVEIGVSLQDIDAADVTRLKLPSATGALVTAVRADGPAAKAGFKIGDVVVSFDGQTVRSARQLVRLVDETPDGREVEAAVVRDGARVVLKVAPVATDTLGGLLSNNGPLRQFQFNGPNGFTLAQPFFADCFDTLNTGNGGRLGVEVQELAGQLGDYFGTKDGVLVTTVDDGTPAKTAGLKPGDVITKINGRPVLSPDDLRRRITGASGDVTITIVRDRKEQALTVKLDGTAPRTIIK